MPSPAWPRTPSPSARPDRQLRLEKTTFPPAGSPNKARTHGTAVRSQPLSPGGPTSRALCSETPHRPRCLAPSPAPNPQTPAPKARTPSLGSKCEPWCPALIPVPPGTSPISAPLHAAEPSRSPSAAAPNPLPKLAPCPAHPKARCPAHASVPVSPRPRQHSSPAPLSARISTGATSSVPPPAPATRPPASISTGLGTTHGDGAQHGGQGLPSHGGAAGCPHKP